MGEAMAMVVEDIRGKQIQDVLTGPPFVAPSAWAHVWRCLGSALWWLCVCSVSQ